jgi:hypothetical protein
MDPLAGFHSKGPAKPALLLLRPSDNHAGPGQREARAGAPTTIAAWVESSGDSSSCGFLRLTAAITRPSRGAGSRTRTRLRQRAVAADRMGKARRSGRSMQVAHPATFHRPTRAARATRPASASSDIPARWPRRGLVTAEGTCSAHRPSLPRRCELPLVHLAPQAPAVALARIRRVCAFSGSDELRIASTGSACSPPSAENCMTSGRQSLPPASGDIPARWPRRVSLRTDLAESRS